MKVLSAEFDDHLTSGATTLCWCWRLERRDGTIFGFTDHDRDIHFEGTTFQAAAGFTASEIKDAVGLSVDNLEVTGALTSEALTEADLAAGRYDDACVEIFRVNWQEPSERVLMRFGSIGEVRRDGLAFVAEVRGLAHYLQQPKGRLYQLACDADLGDGRCKVNPAAGTFSATGTIVEAISARRFKVDGLSGFTHDWFTRGLLTFTSGSAVGQKIEVKAHAKISDVVTVELWVDVEGPLGPSDTFSVQAGCDKRIGTCRTKFGNAVNFRGFPSMPGNDFVTKVARRS